MDRTRSVTRSRLLLCAEQTATMLTARGLDRDARIGVALRDGVETVIACFGIWALGGCAVPLDFRQPAAARAEIARVAGLSAILEDRSTGSDPARLIVNAAWRDERGRAEALKENADGQRPVLISMTSGTGGAPQGIMIDGSRLMKRLFQGHGLTGTENGRYLSVVPMSYSASRNHVLAMILSGGTVIVRPPLFSPDEFVETALRERITHSFIVPTIARGLLALTGTKAAPLLPDIQVLSVGGANLNPDEKALVQETVCWGFNERYSSTLTGNISELSGPDVSAHPETAGRIRPEVTLQIVDEAGTPLPNGAEGLIRVRSPYVANGFVSGQGREGSDRMRDGWAYPGDLGRITSAGCLQVLGRQADLILRGGANVYPAEVERALSSVPEVREIAVTAYSDPRLGEDVAAFVVSDIDGIEQQLEEAARRVLTPDKRPRSFTRIPSLPRNANGKVVRARLRQMMEDRI